MPTVDELNKTIAKEQSAMKAIEDQMQSARDKNEPELAEGLQPQLNEHARQISMMQAEIPKAQEREVKEAADKAAKEQKDEDRGIGLSDFF